MRAQITMGFAVLFMASACGVDSFSGPSQNADAGEDGAGSAVHGGGGGADAGTDAIATADVAPPPGCDPTKLPTDDLCVVNDGMGIFVSASLGTAAGDGTRAHPLASLNAGIAAANKVQRRVYACAETYAEQVTLQQGTSVFGYFDCASGWTIGVQHAQIKPPASPAVTATNVVSATRVEAVDFVAPDFTSGGQTSIALLATASPGLTIAHARIHAGTGGSGAAGSDGIQLTDSGSAKNGASTHTDGVCTGGMTPCPTVASIESIAPVGGTNTCTGEAGHDGGPGGSGGTGGKYQALGSPFYSWSGIVTNAVGNPTTPTLQTAQGGSWGSGGSNGAAGASGTAGSNGAAIGVVGVTGYTTSDGTSGTSGSPGQGGGGSAGVVISNTDYPAASYVGDYGWGESGPGGGAGGCPGLAGTAGKGGGASIAILAVQSPFTLDSVTIESSSGGAGGAAGAPSAPTLGGMGGGSAKYTWGGGNGGAGGNAGVSGNGGGGPSLGIAYQGTEPTLLASNVTPGAGGSGVAVRVVNGLTIPASPAGLSQAAYSF